MISKREILCFQCYQLLLGYRIFVPSLEGNFVPLDKHCLSVWLVGLFVGSREKLSSFFMDDLTRDWGRLSLSNQEGSGFCLHKDLGSDKFILAAKFFTN